MSKVTLIAPKKLPSIADKLREIADNIDKAVATPCECVLVLEDEDGLETVCLSAKVERTDQDMFEKGYFLLSKGAAHILDNY